MTTVPHTRKRRPPQVATGTCRWVRGLDESGCGRLAVNGTGYDIEPIFALGRVAGFRLTKDDGTTYDVETPARGPWGCDCPDFTFSRPNATTEAAAACKHIRSLKAALAHAAKAVAS